MSNKPLGQIDSVSDLLRHLKTTLGGEVVWYRGQVDSGWSLMPSLARRREWLDAELEMLKRFKQNAYSRLRERPEGEWEWLFLAQHHGVPTRLIDWTENPLMGLYFATERSAAHETVEGKLWLLRPEELNQQTWGDSKILLFGQDGILDDYLPHVVSTKPGASPIAAIASRSFDRIVAQSGTFTVNHKRHTPLEDVHAGDCVESFTIPAYSKEPIRAELEAFGITAASVYPELSNLGSYVKGLY
ncbi:FRG domain-containing protein [Micromonospora orduensis]|uniref:FRG domain-containing protein n=1 Tax=Micromonospora orduensis TaxID=1420891 RepID=UPI0033DB48B9